MCAELSLDWVEKKCDLMKYFIICIPRRHFLWNYKREIDFSRMRIVRENANECQLLIWKVKWEAGRQHAHIRLVSQNGHCKIWFQIPISSGLYAVRKQELPQFRALTIKLRKIISWKLITFAFISYESKFSSSHNNKWIVLIQLTNIIQV